MNDARRSNKRLIDEVRRYFARGGLSLLAARLLGWLRGDVPFLQPLPPLQPVRISAESDSDSVWPPNSLILLRIETANPSRDESVPAV